MSNLSSAQFKAHTMGVTSPEMMKPGTAPAPDWDTHYGKSFKWGYVPKENSLDPNYKPDQLGLIANVTPDFHKWKDASSDPRVQEMKKTWASDWSKIPRYKQNQITAAIKGAPK